MAEIKTVAIANRGEIAKRIVVTCRQMGLKSVLLHASGDTQNEAFRLADETLCIGPADPLQSYLSIEANIKGALGAGAEALHPGYGFLSENPLFVKKCKERGLIFIGPPEEALASFGDKNQARNLCKKAGIPVLPAIENKLKTERDWIKSGEKLGYPLMIKALHGGGGRGMRIARNQKELLELVPLVKQEAENCFQNSEVFFEKYLTKAKHIELQIFVDATGKVFVLGDRDCSLQRRRQKIIEEAPSGISPKIKEEMKDAALALFQMVEYRGAGTVEFLYQKDAFYFLEMNPRLQVEHTVTEMIFGLDLVRAQILTAMKRPAFSNNPFPQGHSIQCRICCEDPFNNFLPTGGELIQSLWPTGFGKRVDSGFGKGDLISPNYDSLISKIITWDSSRIRAIEKMRCALEETILFGCYVNIPFLKHILHLEEFLENKITTNLVEETFPKGLKQKLFPLEESFMETIHKEETGSSHQLYKKDSFQRFNPWSDFLKRDK